MDLNIIYPKYQIDERAPLAWYSRKYALFTHCCANAHEYQPNGILVTQKRILKFETYVCKFTASHPTGSISPFLLSSKSTPRCACV